MIKHAQSGIIIVCKLVDLSWIYGSSSKNEAAHSAVFSL